MDDITLELEQLIDEIEQPDMLSNDYTLEELTQILEELYLAISSQIPEFPISN
ncbi:hypothetical protein VB711_18275 [Cronbergia sp. UHCC 0137]|uniref:hypothetical protein n=1 Tax=Cronbergia sp. UHCC 0137 TaxID=3110239 RepID=UPI002B20DD06|nr:hypothetical protein [Cronbergia sp. UHCC 0137]MEA5619773.1 hypothetical protein [Cronbergia sp. UHCC 0137]